MSVVFVSVLLLHASTAVTFPDFPGAISVKAVDQHGKPLKGVDISFGCEKSDLSSCSKVGKSIYYVAYEGSVMYATCTNATYQISEYGKTNANGTIAQNCDICWSEKKANITGKYAGQIESSEFIWQGVNVSGELNDNRMPYSHPCGVARKNNISLPPNDVVLHFEKDETPPKIADCRVERTGPEKIVVYAIINDNRSEFDSGMKSAFIAFNFFDKTDQSLSKPWIAPEFKRQKENNSIDTNVYSVIWFWQFGSDGRDYQGFEIPPNATSFEFWLLAYDNLDNYNFTEKIVFDLLTNKTTDGCESAGQVAKEPVNWFLYLMNKTDEAIQKEKQKAPRLKIVFIPIGYDSNSSAEFEDISKKAADYFASVTPFKECPIPTERISAVYMPTSACNLTVCSDDCGTGDDLSQNCQFLIQECANNNTNYYDRVVGICRGASCGEACGCADDIPGKSAVINSADCSGAQTYKIVSHELGHTLGLHHVRSTSGINGCWDSEGGACSGPNSADCNLNSTEISKQIMAYCPSMEQHGPAAYDYLNQTALHKYLGVCE